MEIQALFAMNYFPPSIADLFKRTSGAMSVFEGVALANLMGIVPEGIAVEAGSHMGKSAIAIAWGLSAGPERTLHMIDPLFEDEELSNQAAETVEKVSPKIVASMWDTTSLLALREIAKLQGIAEFRKSDIIVHPEVIELAGYPIFAMAFLDSGDHDYTLVRSEFDYLKDKMVPGGLVILHDVGNYQGPLRLYQEAQNEGFVAQPIPWDEIKACVRENGPNDEAESVSWHCRDNPEPCFLAALRKL